MNKKQNFIKDYLTWHYRTLPKRLLTITDNFIQFFTHYFSIKILLSTLFFPWHRVIEVKRRRGWHFSEILQRHSFNFLSSIMGTLLRTVIIVVWFFLCMETAVLGVLAILIWLFLPGATVPLYLAEQQKPEAKKLAQKQFMRKHSLTKETQKEAEVWFERYWTHKNRRFWHKEALLSTPSPTASWHYGYTILLDKYSMDLTEYVNILEDKIIGRDAEIAQLKRILCRQTQPAAILHGPTGSGRHAVVYELAHQIQFDEIGLPDQLKHLRVVKLDTASLFGQYAATAQQRELFEIILWEAYEAGNIILVLDEIHMLAAHFDILAPLIQRGGLKLIGLTTTKQFQRNLQKNEHARKFFENIEINPLAPQFVLRLLESKASQLEEKQGLIFPIETLKRIVELGEKSRTPQPDASLDLLDEIGLIALRERLVTITPKNVNQLAEEKLKIPLVTMGPQEKRKLTQLETLLHEYVVDQDAAVNGIANALRRARLELQSQNRPLASFLFLGPTGVGKTETAKALARIYFGQTSGARPVPDPPVGGDWFRVLRSGSPDVENNILRFDMSNYQTKQDANRLSEQLADTITDQPYGVLLLDEIEKAHPDILNIFLTVIDEGYFYDLEGERVSCNNLFIIGTSNAASEFIRQRLQNELLNAVDTEHNLSSEVIEYVLRKNIFSPEFINRFDAVVVFEPLGKPQLRQIAFIKLENLNERLEKKHNTSIPITNELIDKIIEQGYKPEFGARELNRAIQRLVEDPLAKKLLEE